MKIPKDEIGVIICENCEEEDRCNVYECKFLKKVENALYKLIKRG